MNFQRTRLAPSPTGALHLGHARTFLVTWWLARQSNAQILMRMEDLDLGRAKPESIQQAYDDLRWLGLDWEGPPTVQSQRTPLYDQALQTLWQKNAIYPCTCTRADIAAAVAQSASAPHETEANIRYPGTCAAIQHANLKSQSIAEAARIIQNQTGKNICWRLRVTQPTVTFQDAIAGTQTFNVAADTGDFPLTRFDATPAYQLACVVDDHAMDIDCVVRGDDLLSSTPRQILLYHQLDWHPPTFAHVPLVIGPDGKRLAKRHGESRIAQFRQNGVPAEKIVGWAAWRSGMLPHPREITASDALNLFDLTRLPRNRVILGDDDLNWLS